MSNHIAFLLALVAFPGSALAEENRPNILWITCEDSSPNLGCYGDKDALTANLDALAKGGVRYANAFSVAGVCAPSRSCLITGMYPSTLGSHYMRCVAPLPEGVTGFPAYLRKAGYYCTNNVKQDYNFKTPRGIWDESSNKAHWRNRKKGQPFFAVFNNIGTHESKIRCSDAEYRKLTSSLKKNEFRDPSKITIPPFHPDCPEVRRDWARVHTLITAMDRWAGGLLKQLKDDGLADDTIVFFYADHGVGLPRGKRWLYDTGMRVPLIIHVPKKYQRLAPAKPGTVSEQLVSFVDFGPTVLSLAGVKPPEIMQGVPFLGKHKGKPREAVFGIRDRMDERNDCSRAVRTARYKYIRNYHPYKPWAQTLEYMEHMPTMKAWRKLLASGKLTGPAALWMKPTKPVEEFYDLKTDPHEIKNLAGDSTVEKELTRHRNLHAAWHKETRDLGLLPEAEVYARSKGRTPYQLGKDARAFPQARLLEAARTMDAKEPIPELCKLATDDDSAVRWWGVTGLGVRGKGSKEAETALTKALDDKSMSVRVAAADALRRLGKSDKALSVLVKALADDNPWVRHAAALAIDEMGAGAKQALAALKKATKDDNSYVVRVVRHTLSMLGEKE